MSSLISPERWKALEPLLDRALDTDPAQRRAFYDAVSGGGVVTLRELEVIVEECERPDLTFDTPLPERFPSLFEQEPFEPPTSFGEQFRIEREIGRGGMATVYLARDLRHERDVAIKVLHPEVAAALGVERFLSEIRLTASLRHPHILPLFDSGATDGVLYYVMPYLTGESLRVRLQRERQLPLDDALRIAREVADALGYAHRNGVVHRDIKPENILLQDGQAFVLDFGIALALSRAGGERITQTGLALGTPQYMSPEQASGQSHVDARTDIYSLGAVLYEMLAGEPPYTGPTSQAVIAKMMSSEPPSVRRMRPSIPMKLDAVIRKVLAHVPADRFASAPEFVRALELGETSVEVSGVDATLRGGAPDRRRWPFVVASIVALTAVAGFVANRLRNVEPPLVERRVLVVPFENKTGSKELDALGDAAADNLRRDLVREKLGEVVDSRDIGDAPSRSTIQAVRNLARRHGAARVLRGSYYRHGDSLRFEPQILESRSGGLEETVLPVTVPLASPSSAMELLRQGVLAGFAVLADTLFDAWSIASHPSRYDAYLEYVASRHTGTVGTRMEDGHLRRANLLDSNFTMPLARLSWEGNGGCMVADSIVKRLGTRLAGLPVFDRATISGNQAHCRGWRDLEVKAARELYEAAPKSERIVMGFAFVVRHNNYIREALAAMDRIDSLGHRHGLMYWGNRAIPYHLLGMYDQELATVRRLRRIEHDNWENMAWEGRALAALGRVAELGPLLDEMESVALNTDQVGTPTGWIRHVGRELRIHGHPDEARQVFERVLAWFRLRPVPTGPDMQEEFARALYDAGRWDEARDATLRVLRTDTTTLDDSANPTYKPKLMSARTLLGAIAARRGDRRTVDRTDAWLASLTGPYLHGDHTFERARLAAILGDRVRADALLKQAIDQGYGVEQSVGPHDDPDFDSIRDMPAFKSLYRDKS